MKSSNLARARLTLIGRKTDLNRNANGKLNRQCDSALKSVPVLISPAGIDTGAFSG